MTAQDELRNLTTLRTGGRPEAYFRPGNTAELRRALQDCAERGMPWRVLGGGSNLLVEGGVLPGALIHMHAPGFSRVQRTDRGLRVGAGTPVGRVVARCKHEGLGGLEFLAGLPGTVGGALAGNAGAWGCSVADRLRSVSVMSGAGRQRRLAPHELDMSYRHSGLDGLVITGAEFELQPRDPELVAAQVRDYLQRRRERHPLGAASAGCIFKNPVGSSAGKLLDEAGMKGARVGDAAVSEKHANFIVNRGEATAQDVLALIGRMRRAVQERFGIELELEVRHWHARDAETGTPPAAPAAISTADTLGASSARGAA
jgi:UDP-N-acetylmuramate dehydrogenase